MDAFAVKESLNGMLRCPCLSHELPKWIASCSEDESSIGRARFSRLLLVVLESSDVFENADICAFLRSSNQITNVGAGCG